MNPWTAWFRSLTRPFTQWESMLDAATLRCQRPLWERISPRIAELDYFEARGYIRARAIRVVKQELPNTLAQFGPLSPPRLARLQHDLLQQLTCWAVAEAGRQRRAQQARRQAA